MADAKRWERTKRIVGDALALPATERAAFIDAECSDDAALRADVLSLLEVDTSTRFLRAPDTALRRAAQLPPNTAIEPIQHVGSWELLEVIGRGGMGIVHRARHRDDGRIAAVKVLPSGQFPSEHEVTRFERESAAVRRLDHPGIVKILDSGEDPASRWFAMELVDGHDLARELRALAGAAPEISPFLPPRMAAGYEIAVAELVVRVLDAVQHAHEHGVVHRDLKPSNILIDSRLEPKVADFGLARVSTDTTITRTSDVGGTAQYMSPEQTRSLHDRLDARSDVWSIGVVLYELLTLARPFDAPSPTAVQHAIVMDDPIPPHERNRRVPRALSAICLRALEKAPHRRYASARAFADELRKFVAGESIDATLPGIAARARSIGRRRRVPLLAAAAVVVSTIVVVVGWSTWQRGARADDLMVSLERVLDVAPFSRGDLALVARARDDVVELGAARGRDAATRQRIDRFEAERAAFIARLDAEVRVHEASARDETLPTRERVTAGATAVRLYQDLHLLDPASSRYTAGADAAWSLPVVDVLARDATGAVLPATVEMITLDLDTRTPLVRSVLGPADRAYAVGAGHARFVVRFASGAVREFDRAPGVDAMHVTLDATLVEHVAGTLPELVDFQGGTLRLDAKHAASGCPSIGVEVRVAPFALAKHETTIAQYRAFLVATQASAPAHWGDDMEPWCDALPITGLSQQEIDAYLAWAGLRLPTHAEWEFALTGGGVRRFAWGDENDPTRVVCGMPPFPSVRWLLAGTTPEAARQRREILRDYLRPVGSIPSGNTPEGIADLLGNVAEIVSGPVVGSNGAFTELRDFDRWLLGGSSTCDAAVVNVTHSFESMFGPLNRPPLVGFRCARSLDP